MSFFWPCKYEGCKEVIDGSKYNPNKKLCHLHSTMRYKERNDEANKKRQETKLIRRLIRESGIRCRICKSKLGKGKSSYCSDDCKKTGAKIRNQRHYARLSIQHHLSKYQEYKKRLEELYKL